MNKKIKEDWIEALRSGEYSQGAGYLSHLGNHCCLGVLCDLYVKEGLGMWKSDKDDPKKICDLEDISFAEDGILPDAVKRWADMDSNTGKLCLDSSEVEELDLWNAVDANSNEESHVTYLTEINDVGLPFDQIANLIEKHL